jgi:hypothetical protein
MFSIPRPPLYQKAALTLILQLNIVLAFDPSRGRSHEASRGWGRTRRLRAGDERSSRTRAAPGLRPVAPPARSWVTAAAGQAWPGLCRFRPPARGRSGRGQRRVQTIPEKRGRALHPAPRRWRFCVRTATLLEHLSIVPDRTRNCRDSAIPFNDIEARARRSRLERRRRATRQRQAGPGDKDHGRQDQFEVETAEPECH